MHLIPQSWSHLHILVSVFPSVGLVFVLGFYITGVTTKNEVIKRSCLVLFGILALLAIPTFFSGLRPMEVFSQDPKVSQSVMNAHYYWGLGALAILLITGGYAVVELLRVGKPSDQALKVMLGLAGLTLILTIVVDELGWEISHHELERVVPADQAATARPQAWSHVHMI